MKICAIFKLLNIFSDCCWVFYPAPTCSWIWIKCTSFPAQLLTTSAKETSACPAQERDSLRTNNSELFISMTNRHIFKGFALQKLPKLPSCKCDFTSLKLPNNTEIPKGSFKLFSQKCFHAFVFSWLPFYRSNWKTEMVKKYLSSIHLQSTDHDYYYYYYSESPFPNNQESLFYAYLLHARGPSMMNGKLFLKVQIMNSSIIKITFKICWQ